MSIQDTAPNESEQHENIRMCLKLIRDFNTLPSDILPNGMSASYTAHEYVMNGKIKRGYYKYSKTSVPHKNRSNRTKE